MSLSVEQLIEHFKWRYATKHFDPSRKISSALWQTIEEATLLAPSSYGLQPWRMVVVVNPEVRTKLRAAAWDQPQIEDASHLVVFCVRDRVDAGDVDHYIKRIAEVRQASEASLDGFRKMLLESLVSSKTDAEILAWASKQVYIGLGFLLSSAAVLGIDACPMEGFQPGEFNKILGLNGSGYSSLVLAAAGYRAADDRYAKLAKVRFPRSERVTTI